MSKITLELYDLRVCTVNNARYRNGNRTREARDYSDDIHTQLHQYRDKIEKFRKKFSNLPDNYKALHLDINILVPQGKFYTLKGAISRKSIDLDNYLKLLIDAIMDSRYDNRYIKSLGTEVMNLDMDDKYIVSMFAQKEENPNAESKLWDISFTLEIV